MMLRTICIYFAHFSIGLLVFSLSVPWSSLSNQEDEPLAMSFSLRLENFELACGVFWPLSFKFFIFVSHTVYQSSFMTPGFGIQVQKAFLHPQQLFL